MNQSNQLKRPRAYLLYLILLATVSSAKATSLKTPIEKKKDRRLSLALRSGYTQAENTNAGITFYEFSAGINFSLDTKWAVSAEVSQGLLTSNFGTGFTGLGLGVERVIFGENQLRSKTVGLENFESVNVRGVPAPLLSTSFSARQVFFNGSSQVYPFTGVGACIKYRPFSTRTGYWGADACYDYLLNPPNTTSMIRVLIGWSAFLF